MKKKYSARMDSSEFVKEFTKFTGELSKCQEAIPDIYRVKTEPAIIELFGIWFYDSREQELMTEARDKEKDDETKEKFGSFHVDDDDDN